MSRAFSLAGFEVTLIGRFWVTTEAWMRSTTRGSLSFCAWRRTSSSLEMVALFPFANVGRILPIIAHFSEYVELFMRTYIGHAAVAPHQRRVLTLRRKGIFEKNRLQAGLCRKPKSIQRSPDRRSSRWGR